jgi:hypothetical protein
MTSIRVGKDERVVGVVSSSLRFLPSPCRGTVCTFDLARLPGSYTCPAYAHVPLTHIDISVLPFLCSFSDGPNREGLRRTSIGTSRSLLESFSGTGEIAPAQFLSTSPHRILCHTASRRRRSATPGRDLDIRELCNVG